MPESSNKFWSEFRKNFLIKGEPSAVIIALGASLPAFSLLHYGLQFDLSTPIQVILDVYREFIEDIFVYLGPTVTPILTLLGKFFDMNISLNKMWQDYFVVLNLYLIRLSFVFYRDKFSISFLYYLFSALMISFMASILVGAIDTAQGGYLGKFILAFIPITAIFTYYISMDAWRATHATFVARKGSERTLKFWRTYFFGHFVHAIWIYIYGIALISLSLSIPTLAMHSIFGVFICLFYILTVQFYFLYLAYFDAKKRIKDGEVFWAVYWKTGNATLATSIIQVYQGFIWWILVNAGVRLTAIGS